jgi:imidazolonepropionase-like amidohydrolase
MKRALLALATLTCSLGPIQGIWAENLPQVHALTGARLILAPGKVIDQGTIVVRDGIIEAVGADVAIPADARIWNVEKLTIYPGLIEPYRVVAWPEPAKKEGEPLSLIQPERDAALCGDGTCHENELEKLRAAGFTTASFAPGIGIVRGRSAVLNLGAGGIAANLLRRDGALHLSLRPHEGQRTGYPNSKMAAVALLRQTLLDARWQSAATKAFAKKPTQARPALDPTLPVLEAAAAGTTRVFFESEDILDSLRAATLAAEFKLDALLVGSGEEYKRLADLRKFGLTQILPLNFPQAPSAPENDDLDTDLEALRHWHEAPANPLKVQEAGLRFALTSFKLSEPAKLHEMAEKAQERGLSADSILAAFTTVPAELLGLSERAGTLEAGKMANFVVVDGAFFSAKTKIREVWVDGRRYEVKEIKAPTIDPIGTWRLDVSAGGENMKVVLEITGSVSAPEAKISTDAGNLPVQDVTISGDAVLIKFDTALLGMPGSANLTMTVEGETGKGSGLSPAGPFTFTAERQAKSPPSLSAISEVKK